MYNEIKERTADFLDKAVSIIDQDGKLARSKIETHLAGILDLDRPTHTM